MSVALHRSLSKSAVTVLPATNLPSLCGNAARIAIVVVLLSAASASLGLAQAVEKPRAAAANPFSFEDPQKFFQQFFGTDTEEDRREIEKVPVSLREEQQVGSRGVDAYLAELRRQKIKVVSRGKDVEYLQQLIAQLRPHMKHRLRYRVIRVYIAESDKTDARSFPGGTLIFYRGMLDFVDSEAALVGVIGHELSHIDHGHQLYDTKRMKLAQDSFRGANGFSPEQFFKSGRLLMRSFMRPFRPEEEAEADLDGVRWSYELGYDPREMAKVFLRMHERDRDERNVPAFFRTHPYHIDRYRAAIDEFEKLQKERPRETLYVGKLNLKRRIPRSKREFAE